MASLCRDFFGVWVVVPILSWIPGKAQSLIVPCPRLHQDFPDIFLTGPVNVAPLVARPGAVAQQVQHETPSCTEAGIKKSRV